MSDDYLDISLLGGESKSKTEKPAQGESDYLDISLLESAPKPELDVEMAKSHERVPTTDMMPSHEGVKASKFNVEPIPDTTLFDRLLGAKNYIDTHEATRELSADQQRKLAEAPEAFSFYAVDPETGKFNAKQSAKKAWDLAMDDLALAYGAGEGVVRAIEGMALFPVGMLSGLIEGTVSMTELMRQKGFSKSTIRDAIAAARNAEERTFEKFMWSGSDFLGSKKASDITLETIAAPIGWAHQELIRNMKLAGAEDKTIEAGQFMLDASLIILPMLRSLRKAKTIETHQKVSEGKPLTSNEAIEFAKTKQEMLDISVLKKAEKHVEKVQARTQAKQEINAAIEQEFMAFERKVASQAKPMPEIVKDISPEERPDVPSAKMGKEARLELLKTQHEAWLRKQAKQDMSLREEMLLDETEEMMLDAEIAAMREVDPISPSSNNVTKVRKKQPAKRTEKHLEQSDKINGITLETAGNMLKRGDEEVLTHIKEGIKKHGVQLMEHAIRNQELAEQGKMIKDGLSKKQRAQVKSRILELRPQIDSLFEEARRGKKRTKRVERTIAEDVRDNEFYTDLETTLDLAQTYDEPVMINKLKSDPSTAIYKYINDVNRYLHGDKEVNVSAIKTQLLEFQNNKDIMRTYFNSLNDFESFSALVDEGLKYTRMVLGEKIAKETLENAGKKDVTLRSGIDPTDLKEAVKTFKKWFIGDRKVPKSFSNEFKSFIAYADQVRKFKYDPKRRAIGAATKFSEKFLDVKSVPRFRLDQLKGVEAHDAYRKLVLLNGAQTGAKIHFSNARKPIYGGLTRADRRVLDEVLFGLGNIAKAKARAEEALRTGKLRKIVHPAPTEKSFKAHGGKGEPLELNAETVSKALSDYEEILGTDKFNDMLTRSKIYFDTWRELLGMLRDEGLVDQRNFNRLVKMDYLKFENLLDEIDPVQYHNIGGAKIRVRESGITALKKGKLTDMLETDSELIMAHLFSSVYGRIFRNKTNKALYELGKNQPDNGVVKIPKTSKQKSGGKGWTTLDFFDGGKKKLMFVTDEFAAGWVTGNREMSYGASRAIQAVTGTSVLKTFATGINPGFAAVNVPRDIAHMWLTGAIKVGDKWISVYSPHLPVAMIQSANDVLSVGVDAMTRKGRWLDAVDDGVGMSFLAEEGRNLWSRHEMLSNVFTTIKDFASYLNESSEIIGRLAIRERAMRLKAKHAGMRWEDFLEANKKMRPIIDKHGRRTKNPEYDSVPKEIRDKVDDIRLEGSFAARDYIDFSVHGGWSEIGNTFIPYLDPGIQGTKGLFRSGYRNPKEFATKMAWLVGATVMIYAMNRMNHEGKEDLVNEEIKKNNFIIHTNWSFVDSHGATRYLYFKIPKDPGQRYVTYLFEQLTRKHMFGDEVDIPSTWELLKSLSPVQGITSLPPAADAWIVGKQFNIDAYRTMLEGEPSNIYKGPRLPEGARQFEYSPGEFEPPEWAKRIGELTDTSPEIVQYMMGSYFTHGGQALGALTGMAVDKALGAKSPAKDMALAEALTKMPIARRFLGATSVESSVLRKQEKEIKDEHELERWRVKQKMQEHLYAYLVEGTEKISDVTKYIKSEPKHFDALMEELAFAKMLETYAGPRRAFWLRLKAPMSTEARAEMYYHRWSNVSKEEAKQLELDRIRLGTVAGEFSSDDFMTEFIKFRAKRVE